METHGKLWEVRERGIKTVPRTWISGDQRDDDTVTDEGISVCGGAVTDVVDFCLLFVSTSR